ncbi:MAG: hypothetical protein KGZ69_15530 [Methylomonas sp.]|nr:hypothetical protein [Methylomonas sp.]
MTLRKLVLSAALLAAFLLPAFGQSFQGQVGAKKILGRDEATTGQVEQLSVANVNALLGHSYTAAEYGIVCDGSTNDVSALNTALAAINTAGGGILNLPEGTCLLNGATNVTMKSKVLLKGAGIDATILDYGSSFGDGTNGLINFSSISYAGITDLTIAANGDTSGGGNAEAIQISDSDRITVQRIKITNQGEFGIGGQGMTNILIADSIFLRTSQTSTVFNCWFCDFSTTGNGFTSRNLEITRNYIQNGTIQAAGTFYSMVFTDNYSTGAAYGGHMGIGGAYHIIANNTFIDSLDAVDGASTIIGGLEVYGEYQTIMGNYIARNASCGIKLIANDSVVANNVVEGNSINTGSTEAGICLFSFSTLGRPDDAVIVGNRSQNQDYGLSINQVDGDPIERVYISGNNFSGNTTSEIQPNGAATGSNSPRYHTYYKDAVTDNHVPRFDSTQGVLQDSDVVIDDDGDLFLPDGAATAPSLSFTSDTDTGLFWASGLIGAAIDGAEVGRWWKNAATDFRMRTGNPTAASTNNNASIDLTAQSSTAARTMALLGAHFTDTTDATRTSEAFLNLVNGGTIAQGISGATVSWTPTAMTFNGPGSDDVSIRYDVDNFLTFRSSAAGSLGPGLVIDQASASPLASDVSGCLYFNYRDASTNATTGSNICNVVLDTTDGNEDAKITFDVMTGGTKATELELTGAALYATTDQGLDLGSTGGGFATAHINSIELANGTANTLTAASGHLAIEANTVWDSGNDGSGSTLDADLLDGKNTGTSGNVVPLLDGANTFSALQTFSLGSDSANEPLRAVNTTDSAAAETASFEGDRATPTVGDLGYISLKLSNTSGTQTPIAQIGWGASNLTAGSEAGRYDYAVAIAGVMTNVIQINSAGLRPAADGTYDLGTAALQWKSGYLSGLLATSSGARTIASGAIAAVKTFHIVDTEAAGASDDLDTISGGVNGLHLYLRAANDARTVVIKDGTGNIQGPGDCTLDNTQDIAQLLYDSTLTAWLVVACSNNGA